MLRGTKAGSKLVPDGLDSLPALHPLTDSMATSEHYVLPGAEVGGVPQPHHIMPGPLQPTPILYPPNTSALAHCPTTLEGRHSTAHPGPVHQLPSSTTGTPVSETLPQLTQHYGQSMLFPYVASTQTPQSTYCPSSAFQPRQALPFTAGLQPAIPTNVTPTRGFQPTVGYVSPVSTSLQGHQAYSQFQSTSEKPSNTQAAFSPWDSILPRACVTSCSFFLRWLLIDDSHLCPGNSQFLA